MVSLKAGKYRGTQNGQADAEPIHDAKGVELLVSYHPHRGLWVMKLWFTRLVHPEASKRSKRVAATQSPP